MMVTRERGSQRTAIKSVIDAWLPAPTFIISSSSGVVKNYQKRTG
jgi:hypothetical protein